MYVDRRLLYRLRIFCPEKFYALSSFAGHTGTVVAIDGMVGVEWDEPVVKITGKFSGGDCDGKSKSGYGLWGSVSEIEPLVETEIKFRIDLEEFL